MDREIIYITVASFPVAVEQVAHPELRGRPVVVASSGAARSFVMSLSAEAWRAGIRKGMMLSRALRLCRTATVLPPNETLYGRAARAVMDVLARFSPVIEPSGYGCGYLDVTGTGRLFGTPRDAAWKAQKELRLRLRLEASLGVASNKMVSRIASEIIRPTGLQDVPRGGEFSFLSPLPAWRLPGIGPRTREKLEELNLRAIRDIAAMRPEHLTLAFGRLGFMLHQRARGIDNTPVVPAHSVPALEIERRLAEDSNDYDVLKGVVAWLCEEAARQLRERKQCAGRLEVRICYADCREERRAVNIARSLQTASFLYAHALPALDRLLSRRTRARHVHLRLTGFSAGMAQLELFGDPGPERRLKLELALDTLRRRYGPSVIAARK
ncbi:MAG TPA: DNA polymerase IV [Acidobacteriota bacterium]|nr:DNA polymerase IV [Acidobacteriota bacterium]